MSAKPVSRHRAMLPRGAEDEPAAPQPYGIHAAGVTFQH
jgi:hypothetical protein